MGGEVATVVAALPPIQLVALLDSTSLLLYNRYQFYTKKFKSIVPKQSIEQNQ